MIVLTGVAYVKFFVHPVTFDLCNEQSLIDVIVSKMCASRIINVLFIVIVEVNAFVIDQVIVCLIISTLVDAVVFSRFWCTSSLTFFSIAIAITNGLISESCGLIQTLIFFVIIKASSLLKVWIGLALLFVIAFLASTVLALELLRLFNTLLFLWILVLIHLFSLSEQLTTKCKQICSLFYNNLTMNAYIQLKTIIKSQPSLK